MSEKMSKWISVNNRRPKAVTQIVYPSNFATGTQYGVLCTSTWERLGLYDPFMPLPGLPEEDA